MGCTEINKKIVAGGNFAREILYVQSIDEPMLKPNSNAAQTNILRRYHFVIEDGGTGAQEQSLGGQTLGQDILSWELFKHSDKNTNIFISIEILVKTKRLQPDTSGPKEPSISVHGPLIIEAVILKSSAGPPEEIREGAARPALSNSSAGAAPGRAAPTGSYLRFIVSNADYEMAPTDGTLFILLGPSVLDGYFPAWTFSL
ncbi:hypothetical protein EVAR_37922_1 [Eumeta japonica]|uniref:Uncharacterized protein n=1 Tax=Eumeta variegata TaxID=151549 RepID=A0A4C1XBW5_EUMVA|nr:hypothetical protein EVAR_37922_1 [Eumeta japonica]